MQVLSAGVPVTETHHWSPLLPILLRVRQLFGNRHLHARVCHLYSLLCNKECKEVFRLVFYLFI